MGVVSSNFQLRFLPSVPEYERHRPEETVTYRVLQEYWATFVDRTEATFEYGLPRYIHRQVAAFLDCGILANGFVRVKCDHCPREFLLAFSCKKRGLCTSCAARRMSETAALLVDYVVPKVAVRQWVVTVPVLLRYLMARRTDLQRQVLSIVIGAISSYYRHKAKELLGLRAGQTGAITMIQRFGSALNLNIHFHSLFLEGVYDLKARFHRVPAPTDAEVAAVLTKIAHKVIRLLQQHGILTETEEIDTEQLELLTRSEPLLTACIGASIQQRVGLFDQAGQKVHFIGKGFGYWEEPALLKGPLCCSRSGFTLHARTHVETHQRFLLEKLLRYTLRPALSQDRLSITNTGQVRYGLKTPFRDGTIAVEFDPLTFIEKLIALIPKPYTNLIRYHGVLAPNAKLRQQVVPCPAPEKCVRAKKTVHADKPVSPDSNPAHLPEIESRPYRIPWAELLKRVFRIDIAICTHCGGHLRVIAYITQGDVIQTILTHLGLSPIPPPLSPSKFPQFSF